MKIVWTVRFFFLITSCSTLDGSGMIKSQENFLKVKDGKISVHFFGKGPTIVFVAGGPGICGPLYEEKLMGLAKTNTVVFWSYAGCGQSAVNGRKFSVAGDYDDLTTVIAAATKPVVLMGHSYGGLLAIKYASTHQDEVNSLVLINSMPSFSHSEKSMQKKMDRLSQLGLQKEYMSLGAKVFSGLAIKTEFEKFWELETKLQVSQEIYASEVSKKLKPSFSVVTEMQSDLMTLNYSEEFRKLKIPILITAGSLDLIALDRPKEMHSWLPSSTFHEYSKSGHFPFLEENDLFFERTSKWLRTNAFR